MVPLGALWPAILVSALIVFVASNILWMALPFWHRRDYGRVPDERGLLDAVKALPSGQYAFPWMDWKNATPEQRAEAAAGPGGVMIIRNPNSFSFAKALVLYFLLAVAISTVVAYLTGLQLPGGASYERVFRVAGTAGILGWSFNSIADSIWFGRPWSVTIKQVIDGIIYGLLIGGTFGWLWP